jgi:rod shape-determining protein MreC
MRNLIAFYLRFRIFLVFAFLQIVALSTYFSYSDFPKMQLLTTAGSVNAKLLNVRNDVTKHFNLEETNRQLQWENQRLRRKLRYSLYKESKGTLTADGTITIDDTVYKQQYTYVPATVINSTFDKRNNYMTIDIGTNEGVKPGMGVFSSRGVVGVIHNVNGRYAVVKTVLTKDINMVVMDERTGAFGLLKWNGLDPRRGSITGINNDMRIKRWSRVVTRGGSVFPRGLLVGKIERIVNIEGEPLWDITVRYSEDFRSIQHVYVVKNLLLQQQLDIEKQVPEDKEEAE